MHEYQPRTNKENQNRDNMKRLLSSILLLIIPSLCSAKLQLGMGITNQHSGQAGKVFTAIYIDPSDSWEVGFGGITGTLSRNTEWVQVSRQLVDKDLYAGFGILAITHQTSTLTSKYQFITTFGYHHDGWTLSVCHISNGGTGGNNVGENLVFVSWGF
jgi:hypothetical protein